MKRQTPVVLLGLAVLLLTIGIPRGLAQKNRHRRAITSAGSVHAAPLTALQFNNLDPNGPCGAFLATQDANSEIRGVL